MYFQKIALAAAAASTVAAQRPADMPICDYYTTALLKNNTAENQLTLLTLLVNTVVIGNYTTPNVGVKVPGILAAGEFGGKQVNLLPYFNGALASSNRGGSSGVAVNSLDGGGAAPLMMNKPANSMTSNQYFLLTHLYQFFGSLLGCSKQGMAGFDAYTAAPSMYQVHRFMDLSEAENGYFITQVALAAASFGVAQDDIKAVGTALGGLFNVRCAPPTTAIMAQGPQLQSICIADSCPLSPNATCASYDAAVKPQAASSSMASNSTMTSSAGSSMAGTATGTATASTTKTGTSTTATSSSISTAGAVANGVSFAAVAGGLLAFLI